MAVRLWAAISESGGKLRIRQLKGLPPPLTGGQDQRAEMPWPRIVVIEEKPDGIFLYRFAQDGTFAGDTWHQSLEDAKHQALAEYGDTLHSWEQVPPTEPDAAQYALRRATQR